MGRGKFKEGAWRRKGAGLSDITDCIYWVCCLLGVSFGIPLAKMGARKAHLDGMGAKKKKKKAYVERVGPAVYDYEPESCSDGPGRRRLSQARSTEVFETAGEPLLESPGRFAWGAKFGDGCQAVKKLRRARRGVTESGCWRTPKKPCRQAGNPAMHGETDAQPPPSAATRFLLLALRAISSEIPDKQLKILVYSRLFPKPTLGAVH